MKRFLSKLLAAVMCMTMLFSVTAFAAEDPKAVYDDMMAKSQTMNDANLYYHMYMDLTDGTDHIPMEMEMNVLMQSMLDPSNLAFQGILKVKVEDTELPMNIWYKSGFVYMDMMGSKVMTQIPMEQSMNSMLASQNAMLGNSTLVRDLALRTKGDKKILSYTMDPSFLNSYIQQIFSAAGMPTQGISFNIRSITGDYTLTADNQWTDANLDMVMEMSAEGETITMTIKAIVNVLNPGQPVQVFLPNPAEFQLIQ